MPFMSERKWFGWVWTLEKTQLGGLNNYIVKTI